MNNNQRFDDHIINKLAGLEPDVPPYILENILAERRKRKPLPFWFSLVNSRNLLLLFALIITSAATVWLVNKKNTAGPGITIAPGQGHATTGNNIPAGNNNLYDNDALLQNNAAPIDKAVTESTQKDKTGKDDVALPVSTVRHKYTGAKFTAVATPSNTATQDIVIGTEENILPDAGDENINNIPAQGTLYNRLMLGAEKLKGRQKITPAIAKRKTPDMTIPKCPVEKDASGNKKYVELYAAIDYGIRSLTDTGTSSAYLQKRKESTKFAWAYSAGARYTKVFSNSMSVRGGLNFSQITEKFTFAQGNLVQVTYIIDANGDTTGSYTTTGTRYKTTYNKYRTIDIPLLIGYEMGNGRFHTNINAGPVINIYSWQKGDVLDTNNQPVSITTGKSNSPYGFKTNAGVGFMGAVSLYYKLTENLHLMAEPYFRYNFGQMNRTELTIKQKYNTAGFKLGVRLDIP